MLFATVLFLGFFLQVQAIIGGLEAVSPIPWQVSIHLKGKHFCGGTILDSKTVLSAAHCLVGKDTSKMIILAGTTQWRNGEEHEIERYLTNPQKTYIEDTLENDIVLVKLRTRIPFKQGIVQPACLPRKEFNPPTSSSCFASGWGGDNQASITSTLKWIKVSPIEQSDCQNYYTDIIRNTEICAKSPLEVENVCKGDSGGPLICMDGANPVLTGVASAIVTKKQSTGKKVCKPFYPGIYSRVTSHLDWIKDNIDIDEAQSCRLPEWMSVTNYPGLKLMQFFTKKS